MREELFRTLEYLSISGALIMTFTILLMVFRISGFSTESSVLLSAFFTLILLVSRMAKRRLKK
jgi:hypothetical protein